MNGSTLHQDDRFVYWNENPEGKNVEDCTVRAIATVTGKSWEEVYIGLCLYGFIEHDLPSANSVWGAYLRHNGYTRRHLPDTFPDCFTVRMYTESYPEGTYLLALPSHVVAVIDGQYYDTWDSGDKPVLYYWEKER